MKFSEEIKRTQLAVLDAKGWLAEREEQWKAISSAAIRESIVEVQEWLDEVNEILLAAGALAEVAETISLALENRGVAIGVGRRVEEQAKALLARL